MSLSGGHNPGNRSWRRSSPNLQPDGPIVKTLLITVDGQQSRATFTRENGFWSCTHTDSAIAWFKATPFSQIITALLKRNAAWVWEQKA